MTEAVKSEVLVEEGKKIKEVLKHFNVSVRELEKQVKYNRNIINGILNGDYRQDREDVIGSIANQLKLSVEALTGRGLKELEEKFEDEYEKGKIINFENAAFQASQLIKVAITPCELADAWNCFGRALYKLSRYNEALNAYLKSSEYAEKQSNLKKLVRAQNNVLLTYLAKEDHEQVVSVLDLLEKITDKSDQLMQTRYTYYRAEAKSKLKDYATAKALYLETLEAYREASDNSNVAKVTHNIAEMNFKLGKYREALALSKEAISIASQVKELEHDIDVMRCLLLKCYVMINDFETGTKEIEEFSEELESVENLEVKATLKVLEAILTCSVESLCGMIEWKLKEGTKECIAKVIFMNQMKIESPSTYQLYLRTREGKEKYNFLKGEMLK